MSLFLSVAFICRLLAILNTLGFGLTYLLRRQFMPYHGVALKRQWDAMPTAFQILVLALMRAVAAGALATALLSTVILLISFRAGEVWAFWTLPASALVLAGGCAVCDATSGHKHPCQTALCADYDRRCTGNDWLGTVFVWAPRRGLNSSVAKRGRFSAWRYLFAFDNRQNQFGDTTQPAGIVE